MGTTVNYNSINYKDQAYFNQFFATSFDRYDRNRDGKIDYREFQPLVNEMCNMIAQRYGTGPTLDKIRQAWYSMDVNRSGYITRQEFSTKAKREMERILSQPGYGPQPGVQPGYGQPMHGMQPGYGPHQGFVQPHQMYPAHGPVMYGPHY